MKLQAYTVYSKVDIFKYNFWNHHVLTNYPLTIICSEADNLHLYIGSTDRGEHFL